MKASEKRSETALSLGVVARPALSAEAGIGLCNRAFGTFLVCALLLAGALAGAAVAVYNYLTPLTGVTGSLGALIVIALYGYICWRGLRAASRLRDPYPRAAAAGLFALFGFQAAINIGVNVNGFGLFFKRFANGNNLCLVISCGR